MENVFVDVNQKTRINDGSSEIVQASPRPTLMPDHIEATPRRHAILVLFVLAAALNGIPFSHNFIGQAFTKYYNISDSILNLLALVYMGSFLVSFYPANWVFETRGLRFGVLIGLFFTTIGGWLYCGSMKPTLFWVAVVSQGIIGLGQPFMLNVPPYLATIWFPADEVSRACALASFGQPIGVLMGVVVLPFVFTGQDTDTLFQQFLWYHVAYACLITVLLGLSFIVFKDQPTYPPSLARAEQILNPNKISVAKSVLILLKNKIFLVHLLAFGLMNGVQNAFISVISQIILHIYPNLSSSMWVTGLILCITGISSCNLVGLIMDKTHRYKTTALAVLVMAGVSIGFWSAFMNSGVAALYITTSVVGFFSISYLPVGLELAAEITYPVSQVTAISLLSVIGSTMGIAVVYLTTWALQSNGHVAACMTLLAFVIASLIVTGFVRPELRRLEANSKENNEAQ